MVLIATATMEWAFRADGWLHVVLDGQSLLRTPLGLLLYACFAPAYRVVPTHARSTYLVATSLILAVICLGASYTITMAALALLGLAIIHLCKRKQRWPIGTLILIAAYGAFLICPQPAWLPRAHNSEPLFFYLHWAGIAYLFLRIYQVLAEVTSGRMEAPAPGAFLAFLLFAPTLRMGPICRYREFLTQLTGKPESRQWIARTVIRLSTALLRLGIMLVLMRAFPSQILFNAPESLSGFSLLLHLYANAMTFYLWFSGYTDLSIAMGQLMGFSIPDNFNYPWSALSIDDFWRRWHMTLSFWLRDYLFTPLARHRWHFFWAFTITFVACGLWHGTYLSYVLWGLSQGIGMGVRRLWNQYWKRHRQNKTRLYLRLSSLGPVEPFVAKSLCWILTFHYQILTINLFLDENHAFSQLGPHLLKLILPV